MDRNDIGNAGENLTALRLGKYGIFRVYFLGEKAPMVDYLIEINNDDQHPYQAYIQVKSTAKTDRKERYNIGNGNMRTFVPNDKLQQLRQRPIPTYVVGADLIDEVIFIAPAYVVNGPYPSIPSKIKVDNGAQPAVEKELLRLKEDIINYWESHNIPNHKASYISLIS